MLLSAYEIKNHAHFHNGAVGASYQDREEGTHWGEDILDSYNIIVVALF